ncbi:MAG: ATP-binding cassette domain-containing protein [Pseudomonadales bacterium]
MRNNESTEFHRMLSFRNVSLRRGINVLFSAANFTVHRGNRVGLIGANGSGKSSLFQMILSELEADTGEIELAGDNRTHGTGGECQPTAGD